MFQEAKKKKLSGHQNLIMKRKREEDLEKNYSKITQFYRQPITIRDQNNFPSTSSTPTEPGASSCRDEFESPVHSSLSLFSSEESEDSIHNKKIVVPANEDESVITDDNLQLSQDPGLWPDTLTNCQIQILVENGPSHYQNRNETYPRDESGRRFADAYFIRRLSNNEKIKRDWLLYSKVKNATFCFPCKIFNVSNTKKNNKLSDENGFNDWQHLTEHLNHHEKSKTHFENVGKCSDFLSRLKSNKTIDSTVQKLLNIETKYWRAVIERIFYTIQFLAEQNLALRGTNNKLFTKNNGNFLKCIEMIAKFDPVMAEHTKRVQMSAHKRMSHYLGDGIQNEIINLIGHNLRRIILNMVKKAKYFSIILDCTPDTSHQEQISVCVRFVNTNLNMGNSKISVEEHFLTFCPISDTTSEGLTNFLLTALENDNLNIYDLRGQGYDNGANMRGKYNGLQKKILSINRRAFFVPCCNHSLNLIVNDAAKSNILNVIFFSLAHELYNFFSASTNRWSILKKHISNLTLKPLSDTRWSSRIDAITPLKLQLGEFYDALFEISTEKNNNFDNNSKNVATSLAKKIQNFEFICTLILWYNILSKVNIVSKILQTKSFNIAQACDSLKNLNNFLKTYRSDDGFENLLADAKKVANSLDIQAEFKKKDILRARKVKKQFDYEDGDEPITNEELKFKVNCFFSMLDTIITSINERFELLSAHFTTFKFLWNISEFSKYTEQEQLQFCTELENTLTNEDGKERDILGVELLHELQFLQYVDAEMTSSPTDLLNYIISNNLIHSFPNTSVALRILLTIPVSVATAERSFSKLKIIKNYLRSSMGQERLTNLAMISIESELLEELDLALLIGEFSRMKARKVTFFDS